MPQTTIETVEPISEASYVSCLEESDQYVVPVQQTTIEMVEPISEARPDVTQNGMDIEMAEPISEARPNIA